jgi:hypothetical protein
MLRWIGMTFNPPVIPTPLATLSAGLWLHLSLLSPNRATGSNGRAGVYDEIYATVKRYALEPLFLRMHLSRSGPSLLSPIMSMFGQDS